MNLSRTIAAILSPRRGAMKTFLLPSVLLQSSLYSTAAVTKAPSKSPGSSQIPNSNSPRLPSSSPRPSEVPWQPKVANSVKVVGHVASPVQLYIVPNGIFRATSVLKQEKTQEFPQFWIPIMFEGDLAQVAACHLKENDLIYVTGQLSGGSQLLNIQNEQTRIQVMVQSLNFVEAIYPNKKKQAPNGQNDQKERASVISENQGKASKSEKSHWEDLVANPDKWWDHRKDKLDGLVNQKFPDFKHKETKLPLWIDSAPAWVLVALQGLQFDVKKRQNVKPSSKFGVESIAALWKDLVENPSNWWDNRVDKRNPKAPDFKHKVTGEALWMDKKMPAWAQPKLPPLKTRSPVFTSVPGLVASKEQ